MKRLLITLLIPLFVVMFSTAVMADNSHTDKQPVGAKHVFGVHGMTCPFCVVGIKKTFKKIKGVQSVDVSLKHHKVTVYTDKGVCFSKTELKKIFEQAGFSYHGTAEQPDSCEQSS